MLPLAEDCDECGPHYYSRWSIIVSSLPFVLTFLLVSVLSQKKVSGRLSDPSTFKSPVGLPTSPINGRDLAPPIAPKGGSFIKRTHALAFSLTIGFSAVLTELLLCEISNSFNPTARKHALRATVISLLTLLIIVIPQLELHSIVERLGISFASRSNGRPKLAWVLQLGGFTIFLLGFWYVGVFLPHSASTKSETKIHGGIINACLERLGIVGVCLMALLSGFASVSSIWTTFGTKPKPVTEADISRKLTGLDATRDLLTTKRSRARALQHKMSTTTPTNTSLWSRTLSTFRPSAETQELRTLELEISGLETMTQTLDLSLSILQSRHAAQVQSTTRLGRLISTISYLFSCYCVYRIITTSTSLSRRMFLRPTATVAGSDPVTNFIALFARHVYSSLDQQAWAYQISFFLSGVILLASFSAVVQTFSLFARATPSLFQAARSNIALLISQICGMYVISSALMLRSMMPGHVGNVINEALGSGVLEASFVDVWFGVWFMGGVSVTAAGIWLGRKFGAGGGEADWGLDEAWDADVESGKRL
ncbi:MAG: hypothetical protein Q9227_008963 [Pyrenula ochraceoflavens]